MIKGSCGFKDGSLSLEVSTLPSLVDVHGSSAGGDMMCFFCHVISHEHLIEGSCEFIGGSSLQYVTSPDKFCDHKHCDSGDMFLICHVTSREHMFKGLCEFMGEAPHGESIPCHVWWPLV